MKRHDINRTMGIFGQPRHKKEEEFLNAYKKHANDIYRHCYFRVYNKELAEDLTQETFIKTWKYIVQDKEIKNIKAFLYKVAVNLIIDNSRKKKTLALDETKNNPDVIRLTNIESQIFNSVEYKEIIEMINYLDEKHKEVIVMRYVNELLPAEIADILGELPNAISVRINQGMKKLRQIINEKKHYNER